MALTLQKKPFAWGCQVTSFAMVLGVPVMTLAEEIGHDGSEVLWPALAEPVRRRNFHPQELIDCCLRRGYAVTEIQGFPQMKPHIDWPTSKVVRFGPSLDDNWDRFERSVRCSTGVLFGSGLKCEHAVAYDRGAVYDPDGHVYDFGQRQCEARGFIPRLAYRVDRICT